MHQITQQNVTLLLQDCIAGKKGAVDELLPHVDKELRVISSKYLRDEFRNHTIFKLQSWSTKPTLNL